MYIRASCVQVESTQGNESIYCMQPEENKSYLVNRDKCFKRACVDGDKTCEVPVVVDGWVDGWRCDFFARNKFQLVKPSKVTARDVK